MYFLAWIVIGAVIGWGAGGVFQGNGHGPLMDTLMGIGGGIVGGFAMSSVGLGGYGGAIITSLVAMVGAVLLTVLGAYVKGKGISPVSSTNPCTESFGIRRFGLGARR